MKIPFEGYAMRSGILQQKPMLISNKLGFFVTSCSNYQK